MQTSSDITLIRPVSLICEIVCLLFFQKANSCSTVLWQQEPNKVRNKWTNEQSIYCDLKNVKCKGYWNLSNCLKSKITQDSFPIGCIIQQICRYENTQIITILTMIKLQENCGYLLYSHHSKMLSHLLSCHECLERWGSYCADWITVLNLSFKIEFIPHVSSNPNLCSKTQGFMFDKVLQC